MKRIIRWLALPFCVVCAFAGFVSCKKYENAHSRYEITVEYAPENRTLAGTAKVTFENETDSEISILKFQLYGNAYRKDALYKPVSSAYEGAAYYDGESYGETVITSVHGSKNWEVMGEDENILYAYLERPLYTGDKVVLDVGFMTKLAEVNHRTGVTKRTVNLGNFFPILCGMKNAGFVENAYSSIGDPFLSDCAEYKVRLTLPKEYAVAATGEIVSERVLESKKEYTMSASNVRDFAVVLSEDFRVISEKKNGKTLSYYYYDDEKPQETLSLLCESFAYFEETFGDYPYGQYSVAQTGYVHGGMEYPCLTLLSDSLAGEQKMRAVVHETAHQWWYAAVGSDQMENPWQDEGLAEYSSICFFEKYEKYGVSRENCLKEAMQEYRSYYDVYGSVLGRENTRMTRLLSEYINEYEYRCISYDKAVMMLDTLRKSVGDKKFFGSLKKYYKTCLFKTASPGDFVGSFEKLGLEAIL